MKKKLAIVLAVLMAAISIVACGEKASTDTTTQAAATEAAPAEEGTMDYTIVVGFDSEPTSLNSLLTGATLSYWTSDMVHGTLVTFNEDNTEIIPAVAESWEYENDKRLVFHIRKDVYMHNGEQVNAETIKYTMDWNLDEANASKLRSTFSPYIDNVEVVDEFTVAFNLKSTFAPLLKSLWHMPIISASTVGTLESAPVGCGPFVFNEWKKNQYISYTANPNYYGGAPKYSNLKLQFYGSAATLLTAYLAGEVDIIYWMNANDSDTVLATGDSYIYEAIASSRYIMLNQKVEPLNDPTVRKAIQLALDKESIIKYVGNGYGQTCCVALTQTDPYYPTDLNYDRNIEEAKKLLAEAGYPNGFKVELIAPNTTGEGGAATVLQESLRELGLDVELNLLEVAAYLERAKNGDFDLAVCGSTLQPDPHMAMKAWMDNDTTHSQCYWMSDAYTEKMEAAAIELDETKRNALYQEAWKIFVDDAVIDYLFIEDKLAAIRNNIQGFQYHLGYHDFTKMYVVK